jgi:predicted RNA-binding Zn-ribbon protein involved in translation (DUF1610 family)
LAAEVTAAIFAEIDEWYARAPAGASVEQTIDWVQENSEIACPRCGEWLWVIRGDNAGDRGQYHLALCQSPECDFQAAD